MRWIKKHQLIFGRVISILISTTLIGLTILLARNWPSIFTVQTSAFCFLIIVLLTAFSGDMTTGIIVSIIAAACFNYFYLPPVGQFTISTFPDIITFIAFLLTSFVISKLTSSAAKYKNESKNYEIALIQLKELSDWLLSTPDSELTLSKTAQMTLRIFSLDYCSIHSYSENRWYHYSGAAMKDISSQMKPVARN